MRYKIITEPTEPLSLANVKLWARFDSSAHPLDPLISTVLIPAARKKCQEFTGRSFGEQTIQLTLDSFPDSEIYLPRPPVVSITSIEYVDEDGVSQTMSPSAYYLDSSSDDQAWILPALDTEWPATRDQTNAVTITYRAGSNAVPEQVIYAMALEVTACLENPSAVSERQTYALVNGVESLLSPFVVYTRRVPKVKL